MQLQMVIEVCAIERDWAPENISPDTGANFKCERLLDTANGVSWIDPKVFSAENPRFGYTLAIQDKDNQFHPSVSQGGPSDCRLIQRWFALTTIDDSRQRLML